MCCTLARLLVRYIYRVKDELGVSVIPSSIEHFLYLKCNKPHLTSGDHPGDEVEGV